MRSRRCCMKAARRHATWAARRGPPMSARHWQRSWRPGEIAGANTMSGLFTRLFGTKSAGLNWLEVADIRPRLGTVLLVDVRQPEEYHSPPGHLPGAINVPLADVPNRTDELAASGKA